MLQWIRNKLHGLVVRLVAGIISLVFILGAGSYYLFNKNSHSKVLATVDGENISSDIVDSIYNDVVKKFYANSKKQNKDDKDNNENLGLDPKKVRQQILVDVVNNKAIVNAIKSAGFVVTKKQLADSIRNNPIFQSKGEFSIDQYRLLLSRNNITEREYEKNLQESLLFEQFKNNILLSNFILDSELDNFIVKWYQTRSFGYAIIPIGRFLNKQVDDKDIRDYYSNNKKFFIFPETVKIAYIDIVSDRLPNAEFAFNSKANEISKDKLQKYYKEHLDYYTLPESVNVRHILISDYSFNSANNESNDANQDKAKNQAEEILLKLKSGQDFAELAKQYSDDLQSKQTGGNLGWINREETDPDFEKAAFNLNKPGQISDIVKSKFGYHIIELIEKREAKVKDYSKVADQVLKHYKEEHNQSKLNELLEKLSDPAIAKQDLDKIASDINLKVQVTEPFSVNGAKEGAASYKEVVVAAFEKQTNDNVLIKLSEDHFVLFKVISREPSKEKTMEDAYNEIKSIIQHSAAQEQARKYSLDFANKILALKSKNKSTKIDNIEWIVLDKVHRKDTKVNTEILAAAFSLNKISPQKTFNLVNGDFVIALLLSVQDADLKKLLDQQSGLKNKLKEQLTYLQAYVDQRAYEEDLLSKSKIKFIDNSN
jgi:peptidyl-prolyl cis-trans isomerase D